MATTEANGLAPTGVAGGKKLDTIAPLFIAAAITCGMIAAWSIFVTYFVPDHLGLDVFGKHIELASLHNKLMGGLIMGTFLLLFSVFVGELAIVGWENSSFNQLLFKRNRSSWSDLGVLGIQILKIDNLLLMVLTLGVGLLSGVALHDWVKQVTGIDFGVGNLPFAAQVAICLFVYTFLDYWDHRVEHMPVFWPVHRYHHSAEDFYILTAGRIHPANVAGIFILTTPLMFLAPSVETMVVIFTVTGFVRYVIHSRIPSNFGWVGRWLVQSPLDHRMHHILDISEGQGGNYSLFPFWDRVFGTYRPGATPDLVIGVDDKPYRHGVWVFPDILRDYWDFVKEVAKLAGIGRAANPATPIAAAAPQQMRSQDESKLSA